MSESEEIEALEKENQRLKSKLAKTRWFTDEMKRLFNSGNYTRTVERVKELLALKPATRMSDEQLAKIESEIPRDLLFLPHEERIPWQHLNCVLYELKDLRRRS